MLLFDFQPRFGIKWISIFIWHNFNLTSPSFFLFFTMYKGHIFTAKFLRGFWTTLHSAWCIIQKFKCSSKEEKTTRSGNSDPSWTSSWAQLQRCHSGSLAAGCHLTGGGGGHHCCYRVSWACRWILNCVQESTSLCSPKARRNPPTVCRWRRFSKRVYFALCIFINIDCVAADKVTPSDPDNLVGLPRPLWLETLLSKYTKHCALMQVWIHDHGDTVAVRETGPNTPLNLGALCAMLSCCLNGDIRINSEEHAALFEVNVLHFILYNLRCR